MTAPHVDSYRFGRIVIDGQPYDRDLILLPNRILADWRRERGHHLQPLDLAPILADPPEVVVVGRGALGRMELAPEVAEALAGAGIELVAEWSGKACQTYNDLKKSRRVALAIHLTC